MKKITIIALFSLIMFGITISPVLAGNITDQMRESITELTLPTTDAPESVIGGIIQVFISIFGIIFFALMVYGGYKWMIAQGREEEVKKAKDIIRSAIIGLGVVFLAFAISLFVIRGFSAATGLGEQQIVDDET